MTALAGDLDIAMRLPSGRKEPRSQEMPRRRMRLPLQAGAALGVIVLIAIVVGVLGWHSYSSSRSMLLSAFDDTAGFIRDAVNERIRNQLDPAGAQLGFLARGQLSEATNLADRLRQVPLMADVLKHNSLLDAAYIGYPNGEFVLFRLLSGDAAMRTRLEAPGEAVLAVQSQTMDAGGARLGEVRFFDAENQPVGSRKLPDYTYDPRARPWYQLAQAAEGAVLTDPYIFFTTGTPGITLAQRTIDGGGIVGLDIRIAGLGEQVRQIKITPSTELALVNRNDMVVGYKDMGKAMVEDSEGLRLATIHELGIAPLVAARQLDLKDGREAHGSYRADGRDWQLLQSTVDVSETRKIKLLIAIPNDEFFAAAQGLAWRQILIAVAIAIVACILAWFLTSFAVKPLRRLAQETARIEQFDFTSGSRVRSFFGEIDDLGRALRNMTRTIRQFLRIGTALAAERNFTPLLGRVLNETIDVVQADGGSVFMLSDHKGFMKPELALWKDSAGMHEEPGKGLVPIVESGAFADIEQALDSCEMVVSERHLEPQELKDLGLKAMVEAHDAAKLALVIVPLLDRNRAPFGVLILTKALKSADEAWEVDERLRHLIHAVSGSASVAIQNKLLLDAQKALIDSLIKLVAGAIDAKSAYTGGHCQRVPVLTRMLAEAAAAETQGPLAAFKPTQEEWEALDIAAWLHDCGKVTTPEYVVDKATKLETIYDRIHEIRMRFELLKCAEEVKYWRAIAGGAEPEAARAAMEVERKALDEDFVFLAAANEGGEFMEPTKIERIRSIAARRWTRTISMRLGTSYEERARMEKNPEPALPVEEPVLANRPDHIVALAARDIIDPDNRWGFQLKAPGVKYNRGEIYNLSIARGTLTEEERYRINDHIVQTIIMLESLPFPKHLKNVPELAGGHHEKMDGTGYPKQLKGSEMSLVARMMAIADVFEALTAADRPYKKAKKLSEAVKIMGFMKKDRHLDPELLDLFLTSGVWREYAERFLSLDQIDTPDIEAVLKTKPAA